MPIIGQALSDPHEYVRGHANAAACDLQMYMGAMVPGYNASQTDDLIDAMNDLRRQSEA